MKKVFTSIIILLFCIVCAAQNVGIGTTTPGFPLNFASTNGDKISLYGNAGNHFGFGIQNNLLQIHSDAGSSNIAFGSGSSTSFIERMRIINITGYDGMSLNGRLILKNGSTDLVGGGGGVWLYKADNTSQLGFMGTQNNQNIGFFGGPAGWGFTYDAINSRVGIGNNNPNAPLAFPPSLGKKITLYPGATGDVGFAVAGNRLQIYSDNPNADVAIGYDAAGTFNERFAVKPNGVLAINGNTGTVKQILMSNGNSVAPQWTTAGNIIQSFSSGAQGLTRLLGTTVYDFPDATMTFNVSVPVRIIVYYKPGTYVTDCLVGSCNAKWHLQVFLDNTNVENYGVDGVRYASQPNINVESDVTLGPDLFDVEPGTHTISFKAVNSFNQPFARLTAKALIIPR